MEAILEQCSLHFQLISDTLDVSRSEDLYMDAVIKALHSNTLSSNIGVSQREFWRRKCRIHSQR